MARKDKPYLPLYIQDFMTDEKLMECSASATGVYIRIMCVMHKSNPYGTILLKQKDKQTNNQINNFAKKLTKHLPYDLEVILSGLEELINEKCLKIDGDLLIQKRMLEDGALSTKRSESGSKGGKAAHSSTKSFAQAKSQANTDIEIDNDIDIDNRDSIGGAGEEKGRASIKTDTLVYEPPKPFELKSDMPLSGLVLESAERSQFTLTQNKNTEFLKQQWIVFLSERMNDPPGKKMNYREMSDLNSYFLNWVRNKHPKINGTKSKRNSSEKPIPVGDVNSRDFGQL